MFRIENPAEDKGAYVRGMFASIAPYYDFLNRLLSFGRDRYWRRFAVAETALPSGGKALDVCTGTADVALEIARQFPHAGRVVGVDFCGPMLKLGREKVHMAGLDGKIELQMAPAEALPFKGGTFDATTVAFGIRSVRDLKMGLQEMARVTRQGGRVVVLEFSIPPSTAFRRIYHFYFRRILPLVGGAISGNPEAYTYLPRSVSQFPSPEELRDLMLQAGFHQVGYHLLTGGIVAVHVGVK
ncbi:MAG: bifunctional demethylmenaquinone methyltransferase/2-methoxy-6-polyprenyl-1,4-benzoquinol methylase UbiE [candidate division NC10 bacterium]|nr:bifunctional demethylmenaquinone methyltransferase/2-methoxy-6-polyprenyl-1,4-benzoquinol methylase UbiE [candidate division NC10 bacterium]